MEAEAALVVKVSVTADGQLHSEETSEKEHLLVGAALGAKQYVQVS